MEGVAVEGVKVNVELGSAVDVDPVDESGDVWDSVVNAVVVAEVVEAETVVDSGDVVAVVASEGWSYQ